MYHVIFLLGGRTILPAASETVLDRAIGRFKWI